MIIDDLWTAHGPSAADLKVLERLGRHRCAFEAVKPVGEHQTTVRDRQLSVLDDMEECVCEEGHAAPALAQAWQVVDELEARFWEDAAETPVPQTRASGSPSRPNPAKAGPPRGRGRSATQIRAAGSASRPNPAGGEDRAAARLRRSTAPKQPAASSPRAA